MIFREIQGRTAKALRRGNTGHCTDKYMEGMIKEEAQAGTGDPRAVLVTPIDS